jgi:transposase
VQRTPQPRLHEGYAEQLTAQVERMADATLEEHVEEWARSTGMKVSVSSMCRALQRLKQTRKKDIWRERA